MTDPRPTPPPDPLDVLASAGEALASAGDIDTTLSQLLATAATISRADAAAIYLQDPDRSGLEPAVAGGIAEPVFDRLRTGLGAADDPVSTTARERAPLDVEAGGKLGGGFVAATGSVRSSLRPLVLSRSGIDLSLGVLALGWTSKGSLTAEENRVLAALARLAAVAVDHARLGSLFAERSEWFERIAHSDPLTGLANQRTLARVLELELARAGRQGGQVSVALFDVDDFAAANEAAGHEAGDDILRAVAAVLSESVRLVDTVARYGGDEFVLVAPGSAGTTVARRVLAGVGDLPATGGRRPSVSAGVARFPADGTTADELLGAAERALSTAKAGGAGALVEASPQRAG